MTDITKIVHELSRQIVLLRQRITKLEMENSMTPTTLREIVQDHIPEVLQEQAKQIATLQRTVDRLFEHLKLYVGDYGRIYPKPEPKGVMRGGWINVYRYDRVPVLHVSPIIFRTREECDTEGTGHRVACIHIPDFTEGEGL